MTSKQALELILLNVSYVNIRMNLKYEISEIPFPMQTEEFLFELLDSNYRNSFIYN